LFATFGTSLSGNSFVQYNFLLWFCKLLREYNPTHETYSVDLRIRVVQAVNDDKKPPEVARGVLSHGQGVNFKIWEQPCFLERGQVKDDFKDGSGSFALRVNRPDLRQDRGSDRSNDGSSIPVVHVQESAEGTRAFDWRMFGSGAAIGFKERGDQGVERLTLMLGDELALDGVEYGSGFMVHRTIRILMGT
jgi:hypothetical protein